MSLIKDTSIGRDRLCSLAFEGYADGVVVTDLADKIILLNEQAARLLGFGDADEAINTDILDLVEPDERVRATENGNRLSQEGISIETTYRMRRSDGQVFHAEVKRSAVTGDVGQPEALVWTIRNGSYRAVLEKRLLEIHEKERREIGLDLHDGICSGLAGIAYALESLGKGTPAQDELARRVAEIAAELRKMLAEVRRLAEGFHPVPIGPYGITSALKGLCKNVEQHYEVSCVFECPNPVSVEDEDKAIHLFRIAQEAVTNAVKHGEAQHIVISLYRQGDKAILAVEDDGIGLPEELPENKGMGLAIMNYRGRMINAAVAMGKRPQGGTAVECMFKP